MKKISLCVLSFLFICIFAFGCTYADNAKLVDIKVKYDNLINNEQYKDNIFKGENFLPIYNSDKLNNAINRTNSDLTERERVLTLLKASPVLNDYSSCSNYGLLFYAVNSVYLNNSLTITSVANENKVSQSIKTKLYLSLDRLSSLIADFNNKKHAFESIFNDDDRDYQVISNEILTEDGLNRYLNSLNNVLMELLNFNNLANEALYSISPRSDIASQTTNIVYKNDINFLIVDSVLLISNYIVSFNIKTKQDFTALNFDNSLIDILKSIFTISKNEFSDIASESVYSNYKLIYTQESGIINKEKLFTSALRNLTFEDFSKTTLSKDKTTSIEVIENYKIELKNYCNNLLEFLNNLTK